MASDIRATTPSSTTIVANVFERPDYRDAFLVEQPGHQTVADFATAFFLNQPRWLSLVSMNLPSRDKLVAALGDRTYEAGSAVGSWKIHHRSDAEIVFGENMGFMEYRLSFFLRPDGDVEASTVVKYASRRIGAIYFGLVKPMHRRFVPLALRAAGRGAPSVAGVAA